MSPAIVTGILTAIPWKDLLQHGPALLDSAKGLFKKSTQNDAQGTIEQRIAKLERNEKDQARLIEQLVERQELLLSAIRVINFRLKALFICTIVAAVVLVACAAIILLR